MTNSTFTIYGPGERAPRSVAGGFPRRENPAFNADRAGVHELQAELFAMRERLASIHSEPLLVAQVVEVRQNADDADAEPRMMIALDRQVIDIAAIPGAVVGSRVRLHRQTSQAVDVIEAGNGRDNGDAIVPVGSVAVVARCEGGVVEADIMNVLRSFRAPSGVTYRKGERVVVDASMTYVIGSLGMAPQAFAYAPTFDVSWDDVGGHAGAKAALREALELPFSHPALFAAYGKRSVAGVVLEGPTGTGKTLLAKAAATAIARAHGKSASSGGFVSVKGPELLNAYIGRTEEAIRQLFSAAREHKKAHGYPAVIFLDECDALLGVRDHTSKLSINSTTVPQFLAEMDGIDDKAAVLILATNRADMLDPAVTREGRIDRRVHVGRPSKDDAREIAAIHLRGRPLTCELSKIDGAANHLAEAIFDPALIVERIEQLGATLTLSSFVSGAMIAGIVEQATTAAMMRDIASSSQTATGVSLADLDWAVLEATTALVHSNHAEAISELIDNAKAGAHVG